MTEGALTHPPLLGARWPKAQVSGWQDRCPLKAWRAEREKGTAARGPRAGGHLPGGCEHGPLLGATTRTAGSQPSRPEWAARPGVTKGQGCLRPLDSTLSQLRDRAATLLFTHRDDPKGGVGGERKRWCINPRGRGRGRGRQACVFKRIFI